MCHLYRALNTENNKLASKSNRKHHQQRLNECKAQAKAMETVHKDSFEAFMAKDASEHESKVGIVCC